MRTRSGCGYALPNASSSTARSSNAVNEGQDDHQATPSASDGEHSPQFTPSPHTVLSHNIDGLMPAFIDAGAIISLRVSTSGPILPLPTPDLEASFEFIITARTKASNRPEQAITFDAWHSILWPDVMRMRLPWADRGGGPFIHVDRIVGESERQRLEFSGISYHWDSGDGGPDLRDSKTTHLHTIPAGGELIVRHTIPWHRLWEHNSSMDEDELAEEGETWVISLVEKEFKNRWRWWCWGDLEGDLKERTLVPYVKGANNGELEPTQKQYEAGWTVGEPYRELRWEIEVGEVALKVGGQ